VPLALAVGFADGGVVVFIPALRAHFVGLDAPQGEHASAAPKRRFSTG